MLVSDVMDVDLGQALMEDNEDEYRKLVKEKKDSRLNMLLEKTDGYVKSFSELVGRRRRAQLEKVCRGRGYGLSMGDGSRNAVAMLAGGQ